MRFLNREFWLALVSAISLATVSVYAEDKPTDSLAALEYRGDLFVSLKQLLTQAKSTYSSPAVASRVTPVELNGQVAAFLNGGDSVALNDGASRVLAKPLLVVDGLLYVNVQDLKQHFGISINDRAVQLADKSLPLKIEKVTPKYRKHSVQKLRPINKVIRLTSDLQAFPSLHAEDKPVNLASNTILICRREVNIDGIDYTLVTNTSRNPESYLVRSNELAHFPEAYLNGTDWKRYMDWFRREGAQGNALKNGERENLSKSVALTVDLCWSIRKYEKGFFDGIAARGTDESPAYVTLFVSGRWAEQHPTEMESLIDLGHEKKVHFIWGIHSWSHPKEGAFMNAFDSGELIEDTLKVESILMEYGVVPSVFYRFPGLIHDRQRLDGILSLNLLPVDADAWLALQGQDDTWGRNWGGPVKDGSIILVHGNGNEPIGIERLNLWLNNHKDIKWRDLSVFLPR